MESKCKIFKNVSVNINRNFNINKKFKLYKFNIYCIWYLICISFPDNHLKELNENNLLIMYKQKNLSSPSLGNESAIVAIHYE